MTKSHATRSCTVFSSPPPHSYKNVVLPLSALTHHSTPHLTPMHSIVYQGTARSGSMQGICILCILCNKLYVYSDFHCRPYGTGHLVVWVCMVCLLELLRQLPKSIHPFTTPCQPGIPLLPLSVMPPFQITLQLVWKRWSTEYLRRYCVNWPPSYTQSTFHNLSFIGLQRQIQRWKYKSNWQYSKDFNLFVSGRR